jgi:hypothetical protein
MPKPEEAAEPKRVPYEKVEGLENTDARTLVRRIAELQNTAKLAEQQKKELAEELKGLLDVFADGQGVQFDGGFGVDYVPEGAQPYKLNVEKLILKVLPAYPGIKAAIKACMEKSGEPRAAHVRVTQPRAAKKEEVV